MKTFFELFAAPWAHALGLTLLHSLWQGLAVFVLYRITEWSIPERKANLRYVLSCVSFAVIPVISIATFFVLKQDSAPATDEFVLIGFSGSGIASQDDLSVAWISRNFPQLLESAIPYLIPFWLLGTLAFASRMISGWLYTEKMREHAIPVEPHWMETLTRLLDQVGIWRKVSLAISTFTEVPVLVGYVKPVVLFPAAMFTGLSSAQVEAILVHELMHIRRNDYLINLFQLAVEAIFFFNPFIWLLSHQIRKEREFACDDAVVRSGGDSLAYANALVQLEEIRHGRFSAALSVAGERSELFTRIKRIMGSTTRSYSGMERLLPLGLLVGGLICASWLTVPASTNNTTPDPKALNLIPLDTPIVEEQTEIVISPDGDRKQEQSVKKTIVIIDKNDQLDTMRIREFEQFSNNDYEKFRNEFRERFRNQFGDFYEQHTEEMESLMDDMFKHFDPTPPDFYQMQREFMMLNDEAVRMHMEEATKAMKEAQAFYQFDTTFEVPIRQFLWMGPMFPDNYSERQLELQSHMEERQLERQARLAELQAEQRARLAEQQARMAAQQIEQAERLMMIEKQLAEQRAYENKYRENQEEFNKALRDALVKDGYLRKEEKIHSLKWDISGEEVHVTVNGKEVKERDAKKYQKMMNEILYGN